MKFRLSLSIVLFVVFILTACQSATPQQPAQAPQQGSGNGQAYPAPQSQAPAPAPQSSNTVVKSGSLYPDPKSGDEIDWSKAEAMIINGEATKIALSSDGKATISLKDGRSLISNVPQGQDVKMIVSACGETCKNIEVTK